jgi:hypothetical protein
MSAQIVTANRLHDGAVVYLSGDGSWSERIVDACVARDSEFAVELLAAGEASERDLLVVGAYLMKVSEDGENQPHGCREWIRSRGPSVRRDLGKQAYGG